MHNFVYLAQRRSQEFSCEPNFGGRASVHYSMIHVTMITCMLFNAGSAIQWYDDDTGQQISAAQAAARFAPCRLDFDNRFPLAYHYSYSTITAPFSSPVVATIYPNIQTWPRWFQNSSTPCSTKGRRQTHGRNSVNSKPIFKIVSLSDARVNLQLSIY